MPAAASAPLSSSELFQVHQNVDGNQVIVPSFVQFLNLEGRELRHLRVDHVLAGHIPPHPLVVAETPQCWWMLFQNSFSFCWSNRHRAGEVSEPTLMKRSGESLAQLPVVAEEGTSEKAAAAAARRNETRKKQKNTFTAPHSQANRSKRSPTRSDKPRCRTNSSSVAGAQAIKPKIPHHVFRNKCQDQADLIPHTSPHQKYHHG